MTDAVWRDWVTLWQSEMAALAVDRETHEALQRAADLWATAALAAVSRDTGGRAGSAAPEGAAAPVAAPDGPRGTTGQPLGTGSADPGGG